MIGSQSYPGYVWNLIFKFFLFYFSTYANVLIVLKKKNFHPFSSVVIKKKKMTVLSDLRIHKHMWLYIWPSIYIHIFLSFALWHGLEAMTPEALMNILRV